MTLMARVMEQTLFDYNPEDNLLKRFEEIHDYIYANDGLSPQQTLNEFLKILFIKIYDEKEGLDMFKLSAEEFKELKNEGRKTPAIERISKLFELTKKEYHGVFDADDKIKLSHGALGFTINKLQSVSLKDSSSDAKGLAFQKFLTHGEKVGKGQFFTPQPVIDFCVRMMNPQANESVIDPCCGSGGFICSAFRHMSKDADKKKREDILLHKIFGIDISREITKISKMKLLLEENVNSNVLCANSLADLDTIKLLLSSTKENNGFDVLLTNPPFGTAGKITDSTILMSFDLGHKWRESEDGFSITPTIVSGQPAEILFIERCLDLLKPGGRMAIVLPNGHFENPSLEYLRDYIKQRARILSVVNLPQETFIPYGTGVKTSLLFLEKNLKQYALDYTIFFSKITKLGYQGNKNATPIYKKDSHGNNITENGRLVLDEDFSDVLGDYTTFLQKGTINSQNSYCISFSEIKGRIDYDFYSPANRGVLDNLEKSSVRLGDIVTIVKTRSQKLKSRERIVDYVELSDINTHSFEIINSTTCAVHELPSRATYELKEGDIITGIAGNSVGTRKHATALVTAEFDGAICTNGFRVLRSPKINPYYLLYYLHSDLFLKQMMMYRTGAAIPNVSDADLNNILVYLPDESKINEIGNKIKETFELRKESRKILESIEL